MRKVLLLVIAAAVMFISGCAPTGQKTAAHMDIVKGKTVAIKSGGWFEDCYKREAGETINIAFSSSKPVGFNAHYHQRRSNETINVLEKSLADRYEGSITAQGDYVYCFMWYNDNPEGVTLTYDMGVEGE